MNFASSVLNVKALVGASNQEKALIGAFSVIIHHRRLIVYSTREGGHCISPRQAAVHCIMQNDAKNNELYIFGGRWAGGWL